MKVGDKAKNIQTGFTIVELLIVIVVIAILAVISIVAYTGIQNRANDTAIRSDLVNIAKKIRAYQAENGQLPEGTAQLTTLGLKATKTAYGNHLVSGGNNYNLLYCWPSAASPYEFAVVAASKSGNVFYFGGGSVKQGAFAFTGSSTAVCSSAGHAIDSGSERDWLYSVNAWQSYVGG